MGYPLGCDEQTSLRDLLVFFKRCLQHDEWELASACVPQLLSSPGGHEDVKDILKAIISNPYGLKWQSVGTPHRLAWFWLQVLENRTDERVPTETREELEFLLLLEELGEEGVQETALKELHLAFLETRTRPPGPGLSTATATCVDSSLRTLLKRGRPTLAQALARLLQGSTPGGLISDSTLQLPFIHHLLEQLQRPEQSTAWVERVCGVLAVLPPGSEHSGSGSGAQFQALCRELWGARGGLLTEEQVLSALLRPHWDALVGVYSATALRLQRDHLLRNTTGLPDDLPEAEKLVLSLCCHEDRPLAWRTTYFECLSSGKHFLEQVLVTGLDLIKREEFSWLEVLLKQEYQPLSRLLLLLGWTHCHSLGSAQRLLHTLHLQQLPANDSVLQEFANFLSSQLAVLEWCKLNHPAVSLDSLVSQLHTLDQHSALYLLHSLTPLARLHHARVLTLLQQPPPRQPGRDDPEVIRTADASVQRNVVLFQGFCAMKYAVYAVCLSTHLHANCTECAGVALHPANGYEQVFLDYLTEVQLHLEAVPALFRLELLENIFSLLFLSSEDFLHPGQGDRTSSTSFSTSSTSSISSPSYSNGTSPSPRAPPLLPAASSKTYDSGATTEEEEEAGEEEVLGGKPRDVGGADEVPAGLAAAAAHSSYLDLGHLVQSCRGFLVDAVAMEGILRLLKEGLEGLSVVGQEEEVRAPAGEAAAAESLGCSVTPQAFGPRLQRLTKRTAEARWRLQIVRSNQAVGSEKPLQDTGLAPPEASAPGQGSGSSLKRTRRRRRSRLGRTISTERTNGEANASTSTPGGGGGGGGSESECECPCGGPHGSLVPAMLAPPESLLVSCIQRGNFMEAQHVSQVFGLEGSECYGELCFMECYQEVLQELARVEQEMEFQSLSPSSSSSEGGVASVGGASGGRNRQSSGRSTLLAIGSAAAAGMAFYSISDIADKLLNTPAQPIPSLEEGYWLDRCSPDQNPQQQPGPLQALLEELSPPAMAAFDLACCHCTLRKTSRQLLDTAERRLHHSLEARGVQVESRLPHPRGISGFPIVLQQISKILNHTPGNNGSAKTDSVGEELQGGGSSPFGCCIQEVLLSCLPTLTQEGIAAHLGLAQRLDQTALTLNAATQDTEGLTGSALLAALMEQAVLKQAELDAHSVRSGMKQILGTLDQLCPFEPDGGANDTPDYMRTFLDFVDTMATVLVRSLGAEDQGEVRLGNPLLVLLQNPFQLLSHLLFDKQVSPERVRSLLQKAGLSLSVEQVILQRCCEATPLWSTRLISDPLHHQDPEPQPDLEPHPDQNHLDIFNVASMTALLHQHLSDHMDTLGEPAPPPKPGSSSDCSEVAADTSTNTASPSTSPPSFSSSFSVSFSSSVVSSSSTATAENSTSSFLLTSQTLTFLKSRSPLLAALACLGAARGGEASRGPPSSGWSGYFRTGTRKDPALDPEQVAHEANALLHEFPVLQAYLGAMACPLLGPDAAALTDEDGGGLGAALCAKPAVSLLLLGGPQGPGAQAAALDAFRQALCSRDLGRALGLLELYGRGGPLEGALRDRLLACAALEDGEEKGIRHLFRVKDPGLRARVALKALERWPLSACLELLEFCLNDLNTEAQLRADLQRRKQELDIYRWMLDLKPTLARSSWQDLRNRSREDPEEMFSIMLQAKEFQLCGAWLKLFPVSDHLQLQLQTEHLLHLLGRRLTEEAHQLLEDVHDVGVALAVCERALDCRPGFAACHFLADHLTANYQCQVTPSRRRHIHALHLGSKVLLALPSEARQDLFPLLSDPLLILEQLLMNLKVEWAGAAVATLRGALLPGAADAGVCLGDVDSLLARYACKALDFPYAPRERARSDSVLSLQDGLLQGPAQDPFPCRADSPADSTGSTPTHTSSVGSSSTERDRDRASAGAGRRSESQFQPPPQPPARKDWVPDTQQDSCMVCHRERFTMFNRRHHCRRCGRLVCQACSEHKMAVEGSGEEGARVCDQCYAYFHCDSDEEPEEAEAVGSPGSVEAEDRMLCLPEVVHRQVRLSASPSENQTLRSEFYYEQAPSAHLCVAILSLHSDQSECGRQLIGHCRGLSRKLNYAEVDAGLLTDVMGQLLFSAKLMFVRAGHSHDLPLCDSFISKVDVLKILVKANYRPVPSLEDIMETPALTRLRNQLLEAEYYQLAVEVSTKSGLEPSGVWQAWGMAFLRAGRLSAARERFSRVLRAPLDRNQPGLGPPLLQEIVHQLENTLRPAPSTPFSEDILASLRELEEVLLDPSKVVRAGPPAPDPRLQKEALHYLTSYGTHLALVGFFMRHDRMKDALAHVLSQECPDEVFLEGVLQPSLEQGSLSTLQGLLESLDPSLEACSRYLIASCQLLQRRRHFHTLYQLQKFMMDHVRAAMTCIRFFSHGAHSYIKLGEQRRWLVRAKEHLRTYLQEQQGRGASARRKSAAACSFRKTMSSSDVSRHINTVELQLEVTRFLQRCETAAAKAAHSPIAMATGGTPPTLFGGTSTKAEVACRVMLGGKNIEEGFGIVYRIIQDFQLDGQALYVRAGQRLVRQRQYAGVRQLLKCVGESGTSSREDGEAVVLSCLSVAEKAPADAKELDALILEIKRPENKVKAYLMCGRLRQAYLQAVKLDPVQAGPWVKEVAQAAEGASDLAMKNICERWLSEHQNKSPQPRQSRPSPN